MKPWQIFAVGTLAAIALFSLHAYESYLAGVLAILILAAVVAGFCLTPKEEIFYLRTTTRARHRDYGLVVEHDRIAVKAELARLWVLFLPTFSAVAFLLATAARGITWKIHLFDGDHEWLFKGDTYEILLFFRFLVIAVFVLLSNWLAERWVLRDANACSAEYVSASGRRVLYGFKDSTGEYYGGQGIPLGPTRPFQLQTIVFYRGEKPALNKIAMCCLFHKFTIVARGILELDRAKDPLLLAAQQRTPQSI